VRRISDDALKRLQEYAWPGNVRELENALMRAAIVARGTVIGADHLILEGLDTGGHDDLSLAAAIRRHVHEVVARVDGDHGEAATLLGITKKELRAHLDAED
jgi:DNA-binding NtrC family response regulator